MTINHQQIDQHLDSGMSTEEAAQLEQWLQDDEHLNQLVARAELHTDLRRSLQRLSIQQEAMDSFNDLTSLSSDKKPESSEQQHTGTPEKTVNSSAASAHVSPKQWLIATVAFAIAAMLLFSFLSLPASDSPKLQTSTAARTHRQDRIPAKRWLVIWPT